MPHRVRDSTTWVASQRRVRIEPARSRYLRTGASSNCSLGPASARSSVLRPTVSYRTSLGTRCRKLDPTRRGSRRSPPPSPPVGAGASRRCAAYRARQRTSRVNAPTQRRTSGWLSGMASVSQTRPPCLRHQCAGLLAGDGGQACVVDGHDGSDDDHVRPRRGVRSAHEPADGRRRSAKDEERSSKERPTQAEVQRQPWPHAVAVRFPDHVEPLRDPIRLELDSDCQDRGVEPGQGDRHGPPLATGDLPAPP
jgi:hypothetical protein